MSPVLNNSQRNAIFKALDVILGNIVIHGFKTHIKWENIALYISTKKLRAIIYGFFTVTPSDIPVKSLVKQYILWSNMSNIPKQLVRHSK